MSHSSSAPDVGSAGSQTRVPPNGRPLPSSETPYVRRKIIDQQEQYRRSQQKKANALPPVTQQSSSPMARSGGNSQEARFAQSLESMKTESRHMENQGYSMRNLTQTAAEMA